MCSRQVSPTSIRSRILKVYAREAYGVAPFEVSPTSIRSRILKEHRGHAPATPWTGFTHVDPFEDTESRDVARQIHEATRVSPTSIRSRILKGGRCEPHGGSSEGFTHVDPFEDTESRV